MTLKFEGLPIDATYIAKIVCSEYPVDGYGLVIEVGGKFVTHNGNGNVVETLDDAAQDFIDECAVDGGVTVTFTKAG